MRGVCWGADGFCLRAVLPRPVFGLIVFLRSRAITWGVGVKWRASVHAITWRVGVGAKWRACAGAALTCNTEALALVQALAWRTRLGAPV